jgi:hypothetical protein
MEASSTTRATGIRAASLTALLAVAYIVAQFFEWAGVLGSAGGPNSQSTAFGIYMLLTPSLLLGPAFVVTMAALHMVAPPSRRVFTLAGLAFAAIYATLTGLVYIIQLEFVAPRIASGNTAGIELLLFVPYRSFLFAVDLYGYSLMSLATLFTAFGLPAVPEARPARWALLANGAILPFLLFQMFVPQLIWIAAFWAITFPLAMVLLVAMFRKMPAPIPDLSRES